METTTKYTNNNNNFKAYFNNEHNIFFNNVQITKELFYTKINKIQYILHIKIAPNNTILTVTNNNGKILSTVTTGTVKLKSTKKNFKTVFNMVISEFIEKLKNLNLKNNILLKFSVPKFLLKKALRRFKYYMQKKSNIFEINRLLPFNGCRPAKSRRKKRKGLRIFKPKI